MFDVADGAKSSSCPTAHQDISAAASALHSSNHSELPVAFEKSSRVDAFLFLLNLAPLESEEKIASMIRCFSQSWSCVLTAAFQLLRLSALSLVVSFKLTVTPTVGSQFTA